MTINLSFDSLVQIHLTILTATFVFLGFSQLILVSAERDPRRDATGYANRLDARRLLVGAAVIGGLAAVASIATIFAASSDRPLFRTVSAILAAVEAAGLLWLLYMSARSLRRG